MIDFSIIKNLSTKNLSKIKFGRGVVGKVNNLGIVSLIVMAIFACTIKNESMVFAFVIVILGAFLFYCKYVFAFAAKNPEIAVLDGAEFVTYKQVELGSKEITVPQPSSSIERPSKLNKAIKTKSFKPNES